MVTTCYGDTVRVHKGGGSGGSQRDLVSDRGSSRDIISLLCGGHRYNSMIGFSIMISGVPDLDLDLD